MGTWIEITRLFGKDFRLDCRSLRGNVDRNTLTYDDEHIHENVVPYVGTWIEIGVVSPDARLQRSFPTWERG